MNYKKARAWQDILLFGGAFVAGVGVWGFDSTFLGLLGLAMVLLSILVWWLYYRCRSAMRALGAETRSIARTAARGSATSLSRRRRKRSSTRKREDENTNDPRLR